MTKLIRKNPLFFAFFLPALTDGTVTLLGQSQNYWTNHALVNEASPAYYFLTVSPWLFILGAVIWFVFWYWLLLLLKKPLNLFLMFCFISGHSWGVASWIFKLLKDIGFYTVTNQLSVISAWGVVVLYFCLVALCATFCLNIYLKKNNS